MITLGLIAMGVMAVILLVMFPVRWRLLPLMSVLVGIVWQMTLVVMPVYLLIKEMTDLAICFVVYLVTTWLLKKFWYDRLEE